MQFLDLKEIKKLMIEKNIDINYIAREIDDVPLNLIREYLNGNHHSTMKIDFVDKLAKLLNVPIAQIVNGNMNT